MARTSAQPQVELSLLCSISFFLNRPRVRPLSAGLNTFGNKKNIETTEFLYDEQFFFLKLCSFDPKLRTNVITNSNEEKSLNLFFTKLRNIYDHILNVIELILFLSWHSRVRAMKGSIRITMAQIATVIDSTVKHGLITGSC